MSYPAILKRVAPFLATFAIGLFIASFFVSISLPRFRSVERGRGWKYREMKMENRSLRLENQRLKAELDAIRRNSESWNGTKLRYVVPQIELEAPAEPGLKHDHHGRR